MAASSLEELLVGDALAKLLIEKGLIMETQYCDRTRPVPTHPQADKAWRGWERMMAAARFKA